jgi:hypothetical protein
LNSATYRRPSILFGEASQKKRVHKFKQTRKKGETIMRITQRDLEAVVKRINSITNNPESPWTRNKETGLNIASIGCYHLSGAYGGVSLNQMASDGGGVRDVFRCGHITKRDLYERMQAFITGLELTK